MTQAQQVRTLLVQLEEQLRQLNLWQSTAPSQQSLASTEPFCIDTLDLSEWLQWLLIPRMHALIDGNKPLPDSCSIHAIAEESFKDLNTDCRALLNTIKQLDQRLSATDYVLN